VIVPSFAFHVTNLFETLPLTVALKVAVPPVMTELVVGVTVTELTTGAATVTVALADFVASAALVAVTVSVPAVAGAVYAPEEVIAPSFAFQATDLFETVPLTVALKIAEPPVCTAAVAGETATEVTTGAATVTVEEADLVVSALLVAVTVTVPAVVGAVKTPAEVMLPAVAFQATDLSVTVPATEAVNWTVAPVSADTGEGETVTPFTTGGALTVIVAVEDFVLSALLVAVIVAVPALEAAA
jgi:hypothetical protein